MWLAYFSVSASIKNSSMAGIILVTLGIPAGGQGPTGLQSGRSRAGPASQSKGYEVPTGEITRKDKSLGLPAGTRLLWKTHTGLSFMRRGKAVKALTPKVRPFRDCQVRGLRDCANREGGIGSSLLHGIPVPLPVVRTPPLRSLDADPWGLRSAQNGPFQPQW